MAVPIVMTPQENVSVAFPLFLIFFLKHLTGRTLKAAPFLDGLEYSRGAYSAMSRAMGYQVVKASSEGGAVWPQAEGPVQRQVDFMWTLASGPRISSSLISLKLGASASVPTYSQAAMAFREWSLGIGGTFRGRITASLPAPSTHRRPTD